MTDKKINELKTARAQMDEVVKGLQYHNKLRNAWRRLKKACAPALLLRRETQGNLI